MAQFGLPPMPWQQQVAEVAGELLPDGTPAYRDVIVTVPRQSGKTTLVLGMEVQRALGWGEPQRVVYSAQSGADARKKLLEDQEPILWPRRKALGIRRVYHSNGDESVAFVNGSRIVLLASQEKSGHGKTLDLAVEDELFADDDFRRDQAIVPAMATRPRAQLLVTSTAGTPASVPLNRAVERGRQAARDDVGTGTAYFEWSKPPDADIEDPAEWWRWMPALGHTIGEAAVAHAKSLLPADEFLRAYGNVMTASDDRAIPAQLWQAVVYPASKVTLGERIALGLDANPERSGVSVVAVDLERRAEQIEHRSGTGWVVDRVAELAVKWDAPVAVDPAGPAGSFVPALRDAGVLVVEISGREMLQACADLFADVVEARIEVRSHPALDAAAAGAQKRTIGDAWCWARRDLNTDVSPLVALTLASWVAKHHMPEVGSKFFVY